MSGETIEQLGQLYENPGFRLYCSFRSPEWGELLVEGINARNEPTPVGGMPDDIRVSLIDVGGKAIQYTLGADVNGGHPYQDLDWYRRLVAVLGRQAKEWVFHEGLYEVLDVVCETDYPIPDRRDPDWSLEKEKEWMGKVLQTIINNDYNYTWDFEGHRQDGAGDYDEWVKNTNDSRH